MNSAVTARLLAAGRIGFGLALIVAPRRVTAPWLGRDAGRAGAQIVSRGLGARDLALGLGAIVAPDDQLPRWVAAAILVDTADAVVTVAAGDSLPLAGRALVGAVASAGAVLGAIALWDPRSRPSRH